MVSLTRIHQPTTPIMGLIICFELTVGQKILVSSPTNLEEEQKDVFAQKPREWFSYEFKPFLGTYNG
ncbi:MAG: hypothetical protein VYA34_08185 [Myxococcota bacterium]|nr:hypothetical protein [Myxococcota bacterium]